MPRHPPYFTDPDSDFEVEAHEARQRSHAQGASVKGGWATLRSGKTVGKRANVQFNNQVSDPAPTDFLMIESDDDSAMSLVVTLKPPALILAGGITSANLNNASGEQDNKQVASQTPVFANPVAVVEWGTGGISDLVEADFLNGAMINVSGSWVRVRAFVENPLDDSTQSLTYTLGAAISPANSKVSNAQRTVTCGFNAIPTKTFVVPKYAKQVSLSCFSGIFGLQPNSPWVGMIRFWRSFSGPVAGHGVGDLLFTMADNRPLPIPAGAYYFSLVTGPATNINSNAGLWSAVFDLAV